MGLVRKDGYFSITDACIKHLPANFLIIRTPKLFLYYFSLGCEKVRELRRGRLREPSGLKEPSSPREAFGRRLVWSGGKSNRRGGRQGWTHGHQELRSRGPGTQGSKSHEVTRCPFKFRISDCRERDVFGFPGFLSLPVTFSLDLSRSQCYPSSGMAETKDSSKLSFLASSFSASKEHELEIVKQRCAHVPLQMMTRGPAALLPAPRLHPRLLCWKVHGPLTLSAIC